VSWTLTLRNIISQAPLGSREAVCAAIDAVFPFVKWVDEDWGLWDSDVGAVEFDLGEDDPVMSIAVSVRARHILIVPVMQLCSDNGWISIMDDNATEDIPVTAADEAAWRAYRAQIKR